jgi:hypothetical protein
MRNCAVENKGYLVYYHYMTWIEERLAQRKALEERTRLIVEHTPAVYQAVWDEILRFVKDGQAAGMVLSTGGSARARVVECHTLGDPSATRQLTVSADDGQLVAGFGMGTVMIFRFDVCADGVVCLKHEGTRVSEREAARLILDPFLFPEFAK